MPQAYVDGANACNTILIGILQSTHSFTLCLSLRFSLYVVHVLSITLASALAIEQLAAMHGVWQLSAVQLDLPIQNNICHLQTIRFLELDGMCEEKVAESSDHEINKLR